MVNAFAERRRRKEQQEQREQQERAREEHHDGINENPVPAEPTGGVLLAAPNAPGARKRMAQFVNDTRKKKRRVNTAVAHDPKPHEFEHFCELNWAKSKDKHCVDADKVHKFMFCQTFREKKKSGGERKNKPPPFDQDNCKKAAGPFLKDDGLVCETLPNPLKPIAWQQFNTCRTVIKNLHHDQRSRGSDGLTWDVAWTVDCRTLERHAKERKPEVKKLNFEEKLDGEMTPCKMAERHGDIEAAMWEDSADARGSRNSCSLTRHRACTLHPTAGILRSESAHSNDMSDFFSLRPPQKELDVHRMWPMINQIPEGKTCHGTRQWGRATRHKMVELCGAGGIAFHLAHRFEITGEFADVSVEDWLDNKKWFNIEPLVDTNGSDNMVPVSSDTCGDHVAKVLKKLGPPVDKKLHLGRDLGTKLLDLNEVDAEEVRRMGQWNQTVCDASHSSKLPMQAIRNLAGHTDASGVCFNTRTVVMPSGELRKLTPFGFALDMKDEVVEADVTGKHTTAAGALEWFCDVSTVPLQDAAAPLVECPKRKSHPIFKDLVFFKSKQFEDFKEEMKLALDKEESPFQASVQKVLPGVNQRLAANTEANRVPAEKVEKGFEKMEETVTDGHNACATQINTLADAVQALIDVTGNNCTDEMIGASLVAAGEALIGGGSTQHMSDSPVRSPQVGRLRKDPTATSTPPTPPETPEHLPLNDSNSNDDQPQEELEPPPSRQSSRLHPNVPVIVESGIERPLRTDELKPQHHANCRMAHAHSSLQDLYNEWFGLGDYFDGLGGIDGRNRLHDASWRKHLKFNCSCNNRPIKGVNAEAKQSNVQPEDVLCDWEPIFERVGKSPGNLVKTLQSLGKIKKRASRGSTKKSRNQQAASQQQSPQRQPLDP